MAVNYVYLSAATSAVSVVGLQLWVFSLLDQFKSSGLIDAGGVNLGNVRHAVELLLRSNVTVALLVNSVVNAFLLAVLCLKTLFFVQLYPLESRKALECIVNYVIYKGTFLPLVVPPNIFEVVLWSTWLVILCSLKIFQSLARDRLERLNASPTATASKYFRVYSALLMVITADFLWMRLCLTIYRSLRSSLFILLFFEPLCIAFETLQSIMVHGFQLFEVWQRHAIDCNANSLGSYDTNKSAAGLLSEWKGLLIRNFGFALDMMTLSMALGHYLIIWWLHGMAFHLVDAVLFLNLRALVSAAVKRIRGFIKLSRALSHLNGALPDATFEELSAYNDECAICRGPMAKAKKLACNHLFHLACLRSWLDQRLAEAYSCPTCRRPLFLSSSQDHQSSHVGQVSNDRHLVEQINIGLDQQILSGHQPPVGTIPNQQQNPSDTVWRGIGIDSNWASSWPNPGIDGAGTSSSIRSVGLSGVQLMMRQLASVGENYARSSLDDAGWNFWPAQHTSSSSVPPSSSLRYSRNAGGLQLRSTSPSINGNITDILPMVDRVREVLPHIPDELIVEDLSRTNNINITVNNLLLMQ